MPTPPAIEIIARGLATRDGRILLCANSKHGYLYLPGGHTEPGESSPAALEREFLEETGLTVNAGRLLLVSENAFTQAGRPRQEINLVFHVEHPPTWPDEIPSREAGIEFRWLDLAAAVDADIRPRTIRAWIAAGCAPDGWVWEAES